MEPVIPVLIVVALVVAWHWILHKTSRGRLWSPLWIAFSTTAAAMFFIVAGLVGYNMMRRGQAFAGPTWSNSVVWWQVEVGVLFIVIAAYFWYRATVTTKFPTSRG